MADDIDRANELDEARRTVEINAIARSLSRKNATGLCIECDEPIEAKRLAALPSALRCIGCQEGMETHKRTHRH